MKKAISIIAAVAMATTMLAACGGGGKTESSSAAASGSESASETTVAGGETGMVANKDKPLVWYNRQPSNSSTGELDKEALHFNDKTYYVGFDANQGAELQGEMIVEYIKKHAAEIDKNGDGTIGYVLAIGDIGHNDSIARTRGVRKALGTAVEKDRSGRQDLQGQRAGFAGDEERGGRYRGRCNGRKRHQHLGFLLRRSD